MNHDKMSRRVFAKCMAAVPLIATMSCTTDVTQRRYRGPRSDHFDGERFFTPGANPPRGWIDALRWSFAGGRVEWPDSCPSPFPPDHPPTRVKTGLRVVLVGHSSFLVQGAGLNILIDPIWSERASPVTFAGPRRKNPPGIAFDDLPPIDVVLVSHNHYDHMDRRTLDRLWARHNPRFVAPLGNEEGLCGGERRMQVETADWGDTVTLGPQVSVRLEPARHWSTRGLGDRNRALWSAFTIRLGDRVVYFAGDTGFGDGRTFEQAASTAGRIDVALLPIGAYAPRWFMEDQHMNPQEAVRAFELLGARTALGCHWGTFQLTDEGFEQPMLDLASALAAKGIPAERFLAMRPGQVWSMT